MELTYTEKNGLLFPNLELDEQPEGTIGKYGRMRKCYLEQKHDGTFTTLVLSGKLTRHLLDIDQAAREQMATLLVLGQSAIQLAEILHGILLHTKALFSGDLPIDSLGDIGKLPVQLQQAMGDSLNARPLRDPHGQVLRLRHIAEFRRLRLQDIPRGIVYQRKPRRIFLIQMQRHLPLHARHS